MTTRAMNLLEVNDLIVHFATQSGVVHAVDGVSFQLAYGERLGIVGESGSGKSVLCRTVMGLTHGRAACISGGVLFDGQSVLGMNERGRRRLWGREMAMVFQDPLGSLHPITPIGEQVVEAVQREPGIGRKDAEERAVELLERVGIPMARQRARMRAHEFSGGMRQRVAIAMAVACRPKLIFADEPTTALDVTVQARILDLFDELCRDFGIGLVMVSHDLAMVGGHTDRVAVMYAGRIAEAGRVADVFAAPRMRYTEALLAAIPRLEPGHQVLPRPIPGQPPRLLDPARGCRFAPRCEFASDLCHREEPPLTAVAGRRGHVYACWHPPAYSQEEIAQSVTEAVEAQR